MDTNRFIAQILKYEQVQDKVVYHLIVQDKMRQTIKNSQFRYSELKSFHSNLKKIIEDYGITLQFQLPSFPGTKIFGTTNKSDSSINDRKQDIESYLNEIFSFKKLWSLPILKEFIGYQDDDENQFMTEFLIDLEREKVKWNPPNMKGITGDIFRVCIESFCREDDTIKYFFKFYDMNAKEYWETKYRYSELKGIKEAIKEENKIFKLKLPKFPKKKVFGQTNEDKQEIFQRRDQLQDYFNIILSEQTLLKFKVIQYFIEDSKWNSEDNELELKELQFKFLSKKLKMDRKNTMGFLRQQNIKGFKTIKEYLDENFEQNENQERHSRKSSGGMSLKLPSIDPIIPKLNFNTDTNIPQQTSSKQDILSVPQKIRKKSSQELLQAKKHKQFSSQSPDKNKKSIQQSIMGSQIMEQQKQQQNNHNYTNLDNKSTRDRSNSQEC